MKKSSAGLTQLQLLVRNKHSIVCQAIDASGRVVVVKTPHKKEVHSWSAERLTNEAAILPHLSAVAGVPLLYDFFWLKTAYGERPILVTEKMPGTTLQEKRKNTAGYVLPVQECLTLLKRIATVLTQVHQRGIVHGDLKLGNVLVTATDTVSIIDWGT